MIGMPHGDFFDFSSLAHFEKLEQSLVTIEAFADFVVSILKSRSDLHSRILICQGDHPRQE